MTPASRHGAENPAMADQAFDEADDEPGTDIAVIGMAGRFPGADDVPTFWRNLREGVESIRPLSDDELSERGVPEALEICDINPATGLSGEGIPHLLSRLVDP